jgi:hypothetical protein
MIDAVVERLIPGDVVRLLGSNTLAIYVAQCEHPIWPNLRLVIWKLDDGSWSHDALDAKQNVGRCMVSPPDRMGILRKALLG